MRFVISGHSYEISPERVIEAVRGIPANPPDKRYKYYVEINGEPYPIKQLIHLVTGLQNIQFNAGPAHLILEKLGFRIGMYGVEPERRIIDVDENSKGTARFLVMLETDEDGFIVASVPALPGCYTQGRTRQEAITNVREAIRGYIASMRKHGEKVPSDVDVEEVEVVV